MGLKHEAGYVSFEAGTRVTMEMCTHASQTKCNDLPE
jgi:hypothetical protein